jgi:XRE family transcriptional regulator, regulator of sulfur utilization
VADHIIKGGGGEMAKKYEEVMAPIREAWSEDTRALVPIVEEHFDRAHRISFGLGEQLAARRAELAISQRELAKASDVPQADISRIERGKGNPKLATLARIADALDCDICLVSRV